MVELAAMGTDAFVTGFQLAGIKKTVLASAKPFEQMQEIIEAKEVGIVITDETTMSKLDEYEREDIENTVNPVFIVLSDRAEDDRLREQLRMVLGVDVWQKE